MMVVVDTQSLDRSGVGGVTGAIHLQLGPHTFPEAGWSDFPIVILAWWLRSILAVVRGPSTSEYLHFMDGPLVVHLVADSSGLLEYRAGVRGPLGPEGNIAGRLDGRGLLESAASAAHALVDECRRRGWKDERVDELEASLLDATAELVHAR